MSQPSILQYLHTIKGKLSLIGVLILCGLCGIGVTTMHSFNDFHNAGELRIQTSELQSDMLLLRRNEKDFLVRKDVKYLDIFKNNKAEMDKNLSQIQELLTGITDDIEHELEDLRIISSNLDSYSVNFDGLVKAQVLVGLNEKSGLLGILRTAAHDAENSINKEGNDRLLSGLLMLRRNEKDFLRRMDLKYQKKFEANYIRLLDDLKASSINLDSKTQIENSVTSYKNGFIKLIEGYKTIGLDQNSGLRNELRSHVHQAEEVLEEVSEHLLVIVSQKESSIKLMFISLALSIAALMLAVLFLTARSIVNPITALIESINSITKSCDFTQRNLINRNDEIGQISTALDQFYHTLHESINETNRVMNAVAIGDFSQRAEVKVKGDLETLRVAANKSAESVMCNMQALEKIMSALKNGDFKQRMDNKVEASFRENVDSAMQSMDSAITEISHVIEAMSDGDFSRRISAPLTGELHALKERINQSLSSVDQAVSEIVDVSVQQQGGDLRSRIEGDYSGQLGELKNSMNDNMSNLEGIMIRLREAVTSITFASGEIAEGNQILSKDVETQASTLENTAATIEEISGTVKNTSDNAQYTKGLSDNARNVAESGGKVVKDAIVAMEDINKSSTMIASIIDVINEIAFQTNLLALNASVEAARAGTQGRGFAVVATEVGSLATRSATAAKEIKELIEVSVAKVETGTNLVNASGDTLDKIVEEMEKVQTAVSEIAVTSNQQNSGIMEVNASVSNLDTLTQNNASMAKGAYQASGTLQEKANELDKIVEFFKVTDHSESTDQIDYRLAG